MAIGFNSIRASDSWRRCRKRNYAMSIKRLFDAVERRGDIGRRVAALVLPISNRPRVTSSCAGKIGLCEPGEHTSGPNLRPETMLLLTQLYIRFWKCRHRLSRFGESSPGHSYQMVSMLVAYPECWRARAAGGTAHRHADERGTQRIPGKRPTPSLRRVRLDRRP